MAERALTPTSYIVLGMLELAPGTPYELKQRVAGSLADFWSVQHAQLYTETKRLAEEGLLTESREREGRRRKTYKITDAGQNALEEWRASPTRGLTELRDPGMLKIFFGADPSTVAAEQLEAHRERLAEYEQVRERVKGAGIVPKGMLLTLDAGIGHEREFVRYWSALI